MDNFDSKAFVENYFAHAGRKGMKWYQNIFTRQKERREKRKAKKVASQAVRKRAKESTKEQIRKSNRASLIAKNLDKFSDEELREIAGRLETQKKIRDIASSDKKRGNDILKTLLLYGTSLAKAYDLLATTNGGKALVLKVSKKSLPTFPNAYKFNFNDSGGGKKATSSKKK